MEQIESMGTGKKRSHVLKMLELKRKLGLFIVVMEVLIMMTSRNALISVSSIYYFFRGEGG